MAILRSSEGRFYDVPDDQLSQFEVPPEQVKGMLGGSGGGQAGPGSGPNQGQAQGEVRPYGHCPPWRNCFRQAPPFRNCFRNQHPNCAGR